MAKLTPPTKTDPDPLPPPAIPPKCTVVEEEDGTLLVSFRISPEVAKRVKLRAYNVPLDTYLWTNILNRAVQDHVY